MKTSQLKCWVGLVLSLNMFAPSIADGQAPWTVTVTPTMNPLPAGFCALVDLKVLDRNGERPRNPAGYLIGPADFDMSVTSRDPRFVASERIDPSNWKVCGCQAGVAGAEATIKASYPAVRLPAANREPGVAFETTTTFTLAPAKGTDEPQGCREPASAPSTASRVLPPPANVTVTGTPALGRVAWQLVGASSYSVERWMENDPACCRASSPQLGASVTTWEDPLPLAGSDAVDARATQRGQRYVYRVTAIHADGQRNFVDIKLVRPEPTNPASFTAKKKTVKLWANIAYYWIAYWDITVTLEWAEVPGASYYSVRGPGLPLTATHYYTSPHKIYVVKDFGPDHAPLNTPGVNTWTVSAVFLPGPVTTAAANFTRASLTFASCGGTSASTC